MQQGIKFQEYDAACQSLAGAESDQHMILQNQAQLLALQPQNSPHFLYNTLSAIQGMQATGGQLDPHSLPDSRPDTAGSILLNRRMNSFAGFSFCVIVLSGHMC